MSATTAHRHLLFLIASTRQPGVRGNTEILARAAAEGLPAEARQTWRALYGLTLLPFQDHRHDRGTYPMPDAADPTSGNRPKAQPMIDSLRLAAEFCGAAWGGELWGQGGEPGTVLADAQALAAAPAFLQLPG